jgi:hypothetical protein
MIVRVLGPRTRRTLLPRNIIIFMFLVLISIRGWVKSQGLVLPEGLGKLKKIHSPHMVSKPRPSGLQRSCEGTTLPHEIMSRTFNICWISYIPLWLPLLATVVMLWVLISSVRLKLCVFVLGLLYRLFCILDAFCSFSLSLSLSHTLLWLNDEAQMLFHCTPDMLSSWLIFFTSVLCVCTVWFNTTEPVDSETGGYGFDSFQPGWWMNLPTFSLVSSILSWKWKDNISN